MALAAGLLIAGFLPMALYHLRFGFYSHFLEDGLFYAGGKRSSWLNLFDSLAFRVSAFRLPPLTFLSGRVSVVSILFAAAFIFLAVYAFRNKTRNRPVTISILAFPLVFLLILAFSSLFVRPRYYVPLYPFILVILSLALVKLPPKVLIPAVMGLCLLALPDHLALVRPTDPGLFLRYRGGEYFQKGINYLPSRDVDTVNRWMDRRPENRGLFLGFAVTKKTGFGVYEDSLAMDEFTHQVREFFNADPSEEEIEGLGMALSRRLRKNPRAEDIFEEIARIRPEHRDILRKGYEKGKETDSPPG
jgi:hypothetical protein